MGYHVLPFRQGVSRSDWKPLSTAEINVRYECRLARMGSWIVVWIVSEQFPAATPHTLPERQGVVPIWLPQILSSRAVV